MLNDPQQHGSTSHEEAPKLHLLQVSHGIYSAAVGADGAVDTLDGVNEASRQAVVSFDADLKPSSMAFDEAEGEDFDSMHLLQTSRDVLASSQAEDNAVSNESSSQAVGSEVQDTIVLGPKDARESTVVLSTESAAADSLPVDSANPTAQGPDSTVALDAVASEDHRSKELRVAAANALTDDKLTAETVHGRQDHSKESGIVSLDAAAEEKAPLAVDHTKMQWPHSAALDESNGKKPSVHEDSALESQASLELASNAPSDEPPHQKKTLQHGMHGMLGYKHRLHSWPHVARAAWQGRGVHNSMSDAGLAFAVLAIFVSILLLLIVGAGRIGRWILDLYRHSEEKNLRQHIEGMRRSPGLDIVNQLIASSVHDSAICRPLASKQLIRLEARVEEAASGFCLWTPLTQQACVRFNATVSRHDKHSRLPVPLSYQCSSIDFVISLLDAPHVRIEIEGRHLSTFDMTAGRMSAKRTFDSAARHWQEFALNSQIGGKALPPSRFRSEHNVLEFQETALVLGTRISVIGELHKNAVGTLLLKPAMEENCKVGEEEWRTSWESTGLKESSSWMPIRNPLSAARKPWLGKVWVSDDPTLLDKEHKHTKYDPVSDGKSKPSRDCSMQIADSVVNLISPNGM
jgi:hypothetical protein